MASLAFWVLFGALCIWGVLALLVYPLMCAGLGLRTCAYRWTRPGGGRWRHYLRGLRGSSLVCTKVPSYFLVNGSDSIGEMPYMLALV